jgi:type IV secretion system protein TrbL
MLLDQIVNTFQAHAGGWEATLRQLALSLFGILATIDIAFTAIRLAFRRADFSEWLAELVNQILFIGFFLWLLMNSADFARAIIDSFRLAAGQAGGVAAIYPSNVLTAGIGIAKQIWQQASVLNLGVSVGFMIGGIVIMICFALIAALMIEALVQSYIIISAGVLFMGFGGSRWTKDFAITIVRYALAAGAKLFVLQLIVGLGQGLITAWATQFDAGTDTNVAIIIGSAIVMLALTWRIPDMVQGLMNGSVSHQGSALTGAAMAVGAGTVAAAAGLAGAGGAAVGAARLASTQLQAAQAAGSAPASRAGRLAAMTGYAARNIADAATSDLGRRFRGDIYAQHGSAPWRMQADLSQRRDLLKAELSKPKPEQGGDGAQPANTIAAKP